MAYLIDSKDIYKTRNIDVRNTSAYYAKIILEAILANPRTRTSEWYRLQASPIQMSFEASSTEVEFTTRINTGTRKTIPHGKEVVDHSQENEIAKFMGISITNS